MFHQKNSGFRMKRITKLRKDHGEKVPKREGKSIGRKRQKRVITGIGIKRHPERPANLRRCVIRGDVGGGGSPGKYGTAVRG